MLFLHIAFSLLMFVLRNHNLHVGCKLSVISGMLSEPYFIYIYIAIYNIMRSCGCSYLLLVSKLINVFISMSYAHVVSANVLKFGL